MGGTLDNIYNNVSFAMGLHTDALARLQEQASSGARINRVSDDPSTSFRILGLNSEERYLGNYLDNLSEVVSRLEHSSSIIDNVITNVVETKTRLTQIINGIYNEDGRRILAQGINDALEQVVLLANTQRLDQYLFGGSNTDSPPYVAELTDGKITGVTYQGSFDGRNVELAPGIRVDAFCVGDNVFSSDRRGDPVFQGDTGAAVGTGTSSVSGYTWLTVTGSAGNYDLSIDGGLTTFNTDGTDTNLAVTNSVTGEVLYVDTTNINNTGDTLVAVPGTHDVFNTLITIRDLLENENGFPETELLELLRNSFGSLDEINNLLVQNQVSIGTKIGFLGNLEDSLKNLKYDAEDETTRLQEADIAQVAIDISRREVLYEMSLSVAARLMSMSLLDFLK
ncbi:MAG: flagellar hook-associated protein 3 [Phycisphaerae bacterium]|nr:flagellar hook-associated protein 3 [Phycisphaerae bacterium]NIP52896.1 flagellar hook-associated protein 3 [Phycisphaerae bacterium]NIS51947.1 flagellar hook-associated protein 3 [Phycisphaerae bacterium]NIU09461.1 flagellar hook-associated protein 3 [Phycisphaerae bacterium]NIU57194.1 flagellar hook-associated protein 3 [Phycisphaerae bacterium]